MTQLGLSWSVDDKSNRARVLALLTQPFGEWRSTLELQAVGGTRAPARVADLRAAGWLIECEGKRGRFRYRLTGKGVAQKRVTLADVFALDRLFRGGC